MADFGIAIGIEAIRAVSKRCYDCSATAKQYPEDAARIHLRLAYVLSRVPEWSNQIKARADEPGCTLLAQNLETALTNLTICVEALGSIDQRTWREEIQLFFKGKDLRTELLKAEATLNKSLLDLNHDNTSFTAQHIASLHEKFLSLQDTDEQTLSSIIKSFDNIPSGNFNNPNETLKDVIDAEFEECYVENKVGDNGPYGKGPSGPKTNDTESTEESFEDDSSLMSNRSSIVFRETCLGIGVVDLQTNDQPSATKPVSVDIGSGKGLGNRNDAKIGHKQDDIIDSAHKQATLIRWVQQNWKLALCMVLTLVFVIVIVVVVMWLPQTSRDEPTQDSVTCFVTPSELRTSVINYLKGDTSVRTKYGTKIGDWCVDTIEDFSWLFGDNMGPYTFYDTFNEDISKWNTSLAKNMSYMFFGANAFNGNLSSWEVSKVTDMFGMFAYAFDFNGDLSSWDVSKVTDMSDMFAGTFAFNGDLSSWDVSKVFDMSSTFADAKAFKGDLSSWDVSKVTSMSDMFNGANAFTGNLSSWDVSKVTDMSYMFEDAFAFNSDLSSWDVSKVTDMSSLFFNAKAFNGDLSSWNVSKVTDMSDMFLGADSFNGVLSSWDVSNVTNM